MKLLIVLIAFYGFYGSNLVDGEFINQQAVEKILNNNVE